MTQVAINGQTVTVVEYAGQRVVTLGMVDVLHQRPEGTARRNFNTNKQHFVEGEDYVSVCADEIRTRKILEISPKAQSDITLLTESGYAMLAKSFTDDLAWKVQRQLVRSYFGGKSAGIHLAASVIDHSMLLRKAIALQGSMLAYNKRQGMEVTQARIKADAQVLEKMGVDLRKECGWQSQPLAVQEQVLTATDIAKALSLPGNKPGEAGNNLLDAAGLYSWTRDTKGRKVWTPTEHGRKFGRYEDKPRAHTSGTVQPWGWYPSVLDVLRLHLATTTEARPFAKSPEPVS